MSKEQQEQQESQKSLQQKGIKEYAASFFWPITATLDFLQRYFKGILLLLLILVLLSSIQTTSLAPPNLMSIELSGTILSAKKVLKQIQEAKDKNIKGVLFIVDSPGGAVAPSLEISLAIKRLNQKKPVLTYAAGTLASGAYYASIWSREIIANPGSAIGSIGVIFEAPNLKGLLDKVGVEPQVVKAGKYKEVGTPFRPWKDYEKKELAKVVYDTYDMFVHDVAKARGLDIKDKDKFAEAHIFTARQAQKVGLIDKIGTIYEAKKELIRLAKVKKPIWKKRDPFEKFIEELSDQTASKLASLLLGLKFF